MSSRVSPAWWIAAMHASRVNSNGSRAEPATDLRLAHAGDARAPFDDVVDVDRAHVARLVGFEQRNVHIAFSVEVVLEDHPNR